MTVSIFVIEKGKTKKWSGISPGERERISEELNRQALTALGYEPVREASDTGKAE